MGLWSLEERRNRVDLIEVFKMAKGLSATPLSTFFTVDSSTRTRGHQYKICKKYSKGNTRHCFFSERVVNRWNSLSAEAVNSSSLNGFKNHLTRIRNKRMGFFMDSVVR